MNATDTRQATTNRYVPGANGGIPSGSAVEILQTVNNGTRKRPELRYKVNYAGAQFWVDADALEAPAP